MKVIKWVRVKLTTVWGLIIAMVICILLGGLLMWITQPTLNASYVACSPDGPINNLVQCPPDHENWVLSWWRDDGYRVTRFIPDEGWQSIGRLPQGIPLRWQDFPAYPNPDDEP